MGNGFARKLEQGKIGESLIAGFLRSRGNYVLPIYEVEMGQGKGPRIYPPVNGGIVSPEIIGPDLITFNREGRVAWVEAKHKSAFTPHRISGGTLTTGIDLHHYEHYCRLADESPWPMWLMFLHRGGSAANCPDDTPTGLFGNDMKYLREHENHRWTKAKPYMVYWAKDNLRQIATLEEVLAANNGGGN